MRAAEAILMRVRHALVAPRARARRGTLVDGWDLADVRALVRGLARAGADGDELASRLDRLLRRFPPDEPVMRRLSRLQQAVAGRGDEDEFCVLTVYVLATEVLCTGPARQTPPRRARSGGNADARRRPPPRRRTTR